jgi:integrase
VASVYRDENGNTRIQFMCPTHRRRKSIRLGKTTQKLADAVLVRVEALVSAKAAGVPADPQARAWVKEAPDELHEKLAAVGLAEPRPKPVTVAGLLALYEADPDGDGTNKSSSRANHRVIGNDLRAFFGDAAAARTITAADAERFKADLAARVGAGTIGRRLRHCRTRFKFADKKGFIAANPFGEVSAPSPLDPDRQAAYAEANDVETLIAAAPPHMKVILALARYGGLRCPSEALPLKWDEMYLDRNPPEMLVHAPKTEHHPGKETRLIPVFAALRPHLEAARRAAAPGAVYVVAGEWADRQRERVATREGGVKNVNLSNQLDPVLKATGLAGWPAPFVTLRASCRTDLHHVPGLTPDTIARWMGHSAAVGSQHYHRVISEEARIATGTGRSGADSGADRSGHEKTRADRTGGSACVASVPSDPVRSCPD